MASVVFINGERGRALVAGNVEALTCAFKAKFASPTAFNSTSAGKICRSEVFFAVSSRLRADGLADSSDSDAGCCMAAANSSVKPSSGIKTEGSSASPERVGTAAEVGLDAKMAMI